MKTIRLTLGAALLAGAQYAPAAVPTAKIEALLAKPAVMCGHFDQSKQLAGMKKPLASEGRFCVVAGKGVLWRTLKPFPSTLRLTRDEIVNYQGDRVAMRLNASTEPVVRLINNVLFSLLSGDLGQLDTLFEGDGSVDAANWHVTLKPRQAALEKAIGTIRLEGGAYVKSIVMNEAGGDRTTIGFSAIKSGEGALLKEEAALF
jgi:hypothetical protein